MQRIPKQEFLVPAIMLAGTGAYLLDAWQLSSEALAFPGALIAVLVASLGFAVFGVLRSRHLLPQDAEQENVPLHSLSAWSLVVVPAILVLAWRYAGAMPVLLASMFIIQIVLGERNWLRAAAYSAAIAMPLYYLFKTILYVRLPAGWLGQIG